MKTSTVTQENFDELCDLARKLLPRNSKLEESLEWMEREKCDTNYKVKSVLGLMYDWFAHGN